VLQEQRGRGSASVAPCDDGSRHAAVRVDDVSSDAASPGSARPSSSAEQQRRWAVVRSVVLSTPRAESMAAAQAASDGMTDYGAAPAASQPMGNVVVSNISGVAEPGSGNPLRALLLNWRSAQKTYIRKRLQGTWFRYDVEQKQRRYVIDPRGTARRAWDFFIVLCVLWNAVVVPYDVAFAPAVPASRAAANTVVDCLFGMDMCLSMATGRVDKTGRLQTEWRVNLRHYARTWLATDLMGTLPLDRIVQAASAASGGGAAHQNLTFLALLKTPRLLRLSKLMRAFDHMRGAGLLRLVRLVVIWALIAHWVACAYFLLGASQHGGVHATSPDANWIAATWASLPAGQPQHASLLDLYALSLSASVMCLVGNGLPSAVTSAERIFNATVSMLGALLQAVVIGNCAQVVSAMGATAARHQARADAALDTARYLNLPGQLQQRMADYFAFFGSSSHPGPSGLAHLQDLSPPLHRDIVVHLYGDALRSVPLFRGLPSSFIAAAAGRVISRIFMANELVFKAGELSRDIYFVIHGTVEVLDGVKGNRVCLLEDGAYFGELALIANVQRSSTVLTLTPAEICSFSGASLAAVLDDFPDVEPVLKERAVQRLAAMNTTGSGGGQTAASAGTMGDTMSPAAELELRSTVRGLAPLLASGGGGGGGKPVALVGSSPAVEAAPPRLHLASSVFSSNRRRSLVATSLGQGM
jgi:hypothetical protein